MGYSSAEELHRAITKLTATIQHIKDKMQGQQTGQGNLSQVSQDRQTDMGYSSAEECHRAITKLTAMIQHIKDKMQGQQTGQGNLSQVGQDRQGDR